MVSSGCVSENSAGDGRCRVPAVAVLMLIADVALVDAIGDDGMVVGSCCAEDVGVIGRPDAASD